MHDGGTDLRQAVQELATRLPDELQPLAALAYNYWWTWARGGSHVFAALDPERWDVARHNPVRLLRDMSNRALRAAASGDIVGRVRDLAGRLSDELDAAPADVPSVAFFCMEYAVHTSLP